MRSPPLGQFDDHLLVRHQFAVLDRARQRALLQRERAAVRVRADEIAILPDIAHRAERVAEDGRRLRVAQDQPPRGRLGDHHPGRHLLQHRFQPRAFGLGGDGRVPRPQQDLHPRLQLHPLHRDDQQLVDAPPQVPRRQPDILPRGEQQEGQEQRQLVRLAPLHPLPHALQRRPVDDAQVERLVQRGIRVGFHDIIPPGQHLRQQAAVLPALHQQEDAVHTGDVPPFRYSPSRLSIKPSNSRVASGFTSMPRAPCSRLSSCTAGRW